MNRFALSIVPVLLAFYFAGCGNQSFDAIDINGFSDDGPDVVVDAVVVDVKPDAIRDAAPDDGVDAVIPHDVAKDTNGVDTNVGVDANVGDHGSSDADAEEPDEGGEDTGAADTGAADTGDTCDPSDCEEWQTCVDGKCAAKVIINEIRVDTSNVDDAGSFVELWARVETDLTGWKIIGTNLNPELNPETDCHEYLTIELTGKIAADGFFVVIDGGYHERVQGVGYQVQSRTNDEVPSPNILQNGPDRIDLRYEYTPVDVVGYGSDASWLNTRPKCQYYAKPAPDPGKNRSLGRDASDPNKNNNSNAFWLCATPTPGAPNQCPTPQPKPALK